jgi:hypothetical protein
MEYIVGSLITLATIMLVARALRPATMTDAHKVRYAQSHIFELIKPFTALGIYDYPILNTQSSKHASSTKQKVLFIENRAYWIKNNALFVSEVIDGVISEDNAQIVDTMALDKVELEQIIFIVEKLTEGTNNDGGYSG